MGIVMGSVMLLALVGMAVVARSQSKLGAGDEHGLTASLMSTESV